MTCKPITYPDGTPITGSADARLSWTRTSSPSVPAGSIDMGVLKWVLIVIAAIIVVVVLGFLIHYSFTRGALQRLFGGAQGNAQGAQGNAQGGTG